MALAEVYIDTSSLDATVRLLITQSRGRWCPALAAVLELPDGLECLTDQHIVTTAHAVTVYLRPSAFLAALVEDGR